MSAGSLEGIRTIGYEYVDQLNPFTPVMSVDERVKVLTSIARQDRYSHAQVLASLMALPQIKIEEMIAHHKLGDAKPLVTEALSARITAHAIITKRVMVEQAQSACQSEIARKKARVQQVATFIQATRREFAKMKSDLARLRESNTQGLEKLQQLKSEQGRIGKEQDKLKIEIKRVNKELDHLEGK